MSARTAPTPRMRVVPEPPPLPDPEKSLIDAIRRMQEWTPDQAIPNIVEDSWLRSTELPATTWCVPGRIPWGMWHCSAPPGMYKSALFDQVAHHVAHGLPIPGTNWTTQRHGSVLVVSPDETAAEAQQRSLEIAEGGSLPGDGAPFTGDHAIVRVSIPDGKTAEQRIHWLWRTISELESGAYDGREHDVVMIIWDTVGHLLGAAEGMNAYEHADILKELNHRMANECRLLAVTNHEGKDGRQIGSVGLVANSNLFTTISAEKADGRGIVEAQKLRGAKRWTLAVEFDDGLIKFDDRLPQETLHGPSTVPARIIAYLRRVVRATAKQIRDALGIDRRQVWTVIRRLWRKGEIVRDDQLQWQISDMGQETLQIVPPPVATPVAPEPVPVVDEPEPEPAADESPEPPEPAQAVSEPPPAQDWHADTSLENAIPAVTTLLESTRVLGKYPIVKFPKLPEPLLKPAKGQPHQVWEGRPNWSNPTLAAGVDVQRLDKPGSYLSALRTDLPIGGLQECDPDMFGGHMVGIHLTDWPEWREPDLPHPGGSRREQGQVWISTPTLVLFDRLARAGRMDPVKVHAQWLAKGSENMLVGMQTAIKTARTRAILLGAEEGQPGYELYLFQKACYSRFVSTLGESTANWQIKRPDWQVLIKAQAFANHWRRADTAKRAGLTVARLCNTDELHVIGKWSVVEGGPFTEGRELSQFTAKAVYQWDVKDVRRARR